VKRLDPRRASFLGARAPGWRQLRLRDGLWLALPLLALAAFLLAASVADYREARLFDDWWSQQASVSKFFGARLDAARALPERMRVRRRVDAEAADPARFRLQVARRSWATWQRDPLASWGSWLDADLIDGNEYLPVEIRKRGDTSVHWLTAKKSFTLKAPRGALYKDYRRLAFSAKTPVSQLVANGLASEFDLLAPDTRIAPVFVNDRFYGLFRVNELVDESFLRRRRRMPGNIFRGDAAERGEVYKGLPRELFYNPYIWDRVATNDRPGTNAWSVLPRFLEDLAGTTFDDHLRLLRWLDRDEIARLLAYLWTTGDLYHLSHVHNHYLYEDPSSGLLHPIPWDTRLLSVDAPPPYAMNQLLRAMLRDPFVFAGTMRALASRVGDDRLPRAAEVLLEPLRTRYADHVALERLRGDEIPPLDAADEALAVLRANLASLAARVDDARTAWHAELGARRPALLDFQAAGHVGPELRALRATGEIPEGARLRLVADRDRDGRLSPADPVLPTRLVREGGEVRLVLEAPVALLPGSDPDAWDIRPAPLHYRFFLEAEGGARLASLRPELVNPLTDARVTPEPWQAGAPIPPDVAWHPWRFPEPSRRSHRLAGRVRLRETLVIGPGETLVIEPGSVLQLDPDVSILARGKVLARGTAERPIRFEATYTRQPWGSVALQGDGASGSRFAHAHFSGGGGAWLDRVEYKGMVSAHWVQDLRFDHCGFADNLRSDDMLNVVHGTVSIDHSSFLRANADALDLDYARGRIVRSHVEDARNDGVDLMASSPVIERVDIIRSGDKGISIGEASAPLLRGVRIEGGEIGIEVKDRSEPVILDSLIAGNRIGLRQYAKNWRYGAGGWATLVNSEIADNVTPLVLRDGSRLTRPGSGDPTPWIRAHYGAGENGACSPIAPLEWQRVDWDFRSLDDGWQAEGGVTRLLKRNGRLSATLRRQRGALVRELDWDLEDPATRYLAVVEWSGRGVTGGSLGFEGAVAVARVPLAAADDVGDYRLETIELPPGRYDVLRLEAESGREGGRLDVRATRLYALPRAGPGARTKDAHD
jgi:hypothetical protein